MDAFLRCETPQSLFSAQGVFFFMLEKKSLETKPSENCHAIIETDLNRSGSIETVKSLIDLKDDRFSELG